MNRQRFTVAAVAVAMATASAAGLMATQASAQGTPAETFQKKCMTCHAPTSPANVKGPSLNGMFGKKIASVSGYAYSDGLKAKSGTWTAANLDAYLTKPKDFAPGTKMIPSVADAAQRKMIIDHMKTLK